MQIRLGHSALALLIFSAASVLSLAGTAQESGTAAGCGESVRIESGDTLGAIATRCGTTVGAIQQANPDLGDPRRLRIGTEIRIPSRSAIAATTDGLAGTSATDGTVGSDTYVIRQGDTWDSIAQKTGSNVEALMEANPQIASVALNDGAELRVPAKSGGAAIRSTVPEGSGGAGGTPSDRGRSSAGSPGEAEPTGLRIAGRLTDEGVECPALRSLDGTLYTLAGDIRQFNPGDEVVVTGKRAEMSHCMQGTTITVESIAPAQ